MPSDQRTFQKENLNPSPAKLLALVALHIGLMEPEFLGGEGGTSERPFAEPAGYPAGAARETETPKFVAAIPSTAPV